MAVGTKRLGRLLRVRTLQHDLARADQAIAARHAETSNHLVRRIEQLVEHVTPAPGPVSALELAAAAGLRARLQRSHEDAAERLSTAQAMLARRQAAAQAARMDQGALEKLLDRARGRESLAQMRALGDLPQPAGRGTRLADADGEGGHDARKGDRW